MCLRHTHTQTHTFFIYTFIHIYIYRYITNNKREDLPRLSLWGYVWVALLSLLIAMLMYVPWRLSKDNYVPWRMVYGLVDLGGGDESWIGANNRGYDGIFSDRRAITIYTLLSHGYWQWPIEIEDLPSYNMVIFHGYVSLPEGVLLSGSRSRFAMESDPSCVDALPTLGRFALQTDTLPLRSWFPKHKCLVNWFFGFHCF